VVSTPANCPSAGASQLLTTLYPRQAINLGGKIAEPGEGGVVSVSMGRVTRLSGNSLVDVYGA